MIMTPKKITPGPGQESVWDYPRPPRVEPTNRRIRVVFAGVVIADSHRAQRILETSHPPVYYIPPADLQLQHLITMPRPGSFCEWKGYARYYSVKVGHQEAVAAAWSYGDPTPAFAAIKDHVAFYVTPMEACYVDDERAAAQPGRFYGGWVTSDVVGPFKGEPGTMGW